jgi:2-iminobutanoate/2-iminopropanoate deaminase
MTLPNAPQQPAPPGPTGAPGAWTPVTLGGDVPPPKGAYSPGVRAGDLVFVSGQVPRDPRTGELVGEDVATQTRQVLANVRGVLEAAGASLRDVVAVTVWLTNVDDWGTFDAVYREAFAPPYPTRAVVGATLRGILVEVSAVAHAPRRDGAAAS